MARPMHPVLHEVADHDDADELQRERGGGDVRTPAAGQQVHQRLAWRQHQERRHLHQQRAAQKPSEVGPPFGAERRLRAQRPQPFDRHEQRAVDQQLHGEHVEPDAEPARRDVAVRRGARQQRQRQHRTADGDGAERLLAPQQQRHGAEGERQHGRSERRRRQPRRQVRAQFGRRQQLRPAHAAGGAEGGEAEHRAERAADPAAAEAVGFVGDEPVRARAAVVHRWRMLRAVSVRVVGTSSRRSRRALHLRSGETAVPANGSVVAVTSSTGPSS